VSEEGGGAWCEIAAAELAAWDRRLLSSDASLFQYPFWNEPFRRMRFSPRYLSYVVEGRPRAYLCILSFGPPAARIGLIQRGPVSLTGEEALPVPALASLGRLAKRRGYIFLRFTHSRGETLDALPAVGRTEPLDPFPFYRDADHALIVEQGDDEAATLAGFQEVARRNIRKALQAGYEIEASTAPERFVAVWPLFQALAERKGFRYRPLASYLDLLRLAEPGRCATLYTASLEGRSVGAILVLRDRTTAHYISGALDVTALGDGASPSCLLHWRAMRDLYQQGARFYNLGTRSGAVEQFKRKFRPLEVIHPSPVTLILNPTLYALWCASVLRVMPPLWRSVKRVISH
jgi:hypothetical protein